MFERSISMTRAGCPLAGELGAAVATYGHRRLELEFRLGHKSGGVGGGGAFVPGVSSECWHQLKKRLDRGQVAAATESRELIRATPTGETCKEVVDQVPPAPRPTFIFKKRLFDHDRPVEGTPWCMRGSLSLEIVEHAPPDQLGPPRFERRKKRWSYRLGCWVVDITRVSSNLPHQLDSDAEAFEVEVELADTRELFTRTTGEIAEWGAKVARDMCDLMAAEDHPDDPEWS